MKPAIRRGIRAPLARRDLVAIFAYINCRRPDAKPVDGLNVRVLSNNGAVYTIIGDVDEQRRDEADVENAVERADFVEAPVHRHRR